MITSSSLMPLFCLCIISFSQIFAQELSEFSEPEQDIELISSTYLGNEERNFYGNKAPDKLDVIWKFELGHGYSSNPRGKSRYKVWTGAGWTGQAATIRHDSTHYLIQPSFSHNLYKINAETGKEVWRYKYDDILKGSPTIWKNDYAWNDMSYVIIQGSRRGYNKSINAKEVLSLRAVNFFSGKVLWFHDAERTRSYSRDVDASPLVINDTLYAPIENGNLIVGDPRPDCGDTINGKNRLKVFSKIKTFDDVDADKHRNNVILEGSPTYFNNYIYMCSGTGWMYGYNTLKDTIDWKFYTGGDMDGSPSVTNDSCLLVSVEKQYIPGKGGIFKFDPTKPAEESVVWYFPVQSKGFAFWNGGVLGSVAINDQYIEKNDQHLAATIAIDGNLYVLNHEFTTGDSVYGPFNKEKYPTPQLVYKYPTGASISTPVITENRLIAAGYEGIHLFHYNDKCIFEHKDKLTDTFESTPVLLNGRAYISSKTGYLYCLGKKDAEK